MGELKKVLQLISHTAFLIEPRSSLLIVTRKLRTEFYEI